MEVSDDALGVRHFQESFGIAAPDRDASAHQGVLIMGS